MAPDAVGSQLAGWGKVALLEVRGRVTGRQIEVAVGYLEEADGALLVAAGAPDTDWAWNLLAEPRCRVRIGERVGEYVAVEIEGAERARAIAGLIVRYGTPAETLGSGPAFRLVPA